MFYLSKLVINSSSCHAHVFLHEVYSTPVGGSSGYSRSGGEGPVGQTTETIMGEKINEPTPHPTTHDHHWKTGLMFFPSITMLTNVSRWWVVVKATFFNLSAVFICSSMWHSLALDHLSFWFRGTR